MTDGIASVAGSVLIAFVSLITVVNTGLELFGLQGITLQLLLGYLFAPQVWILGIPAHEMIQAGSYIDQTVIINGFVAFIDAIQYKEALSEYSQVVITFALCGFVNIGLIAILLGSIRVMAPERRAEVANLGLKAVIAGYCIENLMIYSFLLSINKLYCCIMV